MSKQLAKILSYCALAVLVPFIIVGSAITFSQAVEVTLAIAQAGTTSTLIDEPMISLIVDGKTQEENSLVARKNTVVDLAFEGEGYYFHGWFEGTEAEIDIEKDEPIAKNREGKPQEDIKGYVIRKNVTLTAMRDVQTFNITYTGKNADNSDVSLDKAVGIEYGATLEVLPSTQNKIFAGWVVESDEEMAPTFVAKFAADTQGQEIILTPVWKESANYTVYYSVADLAAEKAINLNYTIVSGFEAYTKTREGYIFKGLTLLENGQETGEVYVYSAEEKDYLCNQAKLSNVLLRRPTAQICAYWESIYAEATFNYLAKAYYKDSVLDEYGEWEVYTAEGGNLAVVGGNDIHVKIQDSTDANKNISLEDNFMDYFMAGYAEKEIVTSEGDVVSFNGDVVIFYSENSITIPFIDEETFEVNPALYDFGFVYSAIAEQLGISSFEGKEFNVYFMYE